MTFIDTSALYALADARDPNHASARGAFAAELAKGRTIVTHNYVLLETIALLQRRLGLDPALRLAEDAANFRLEWITRARHDKALDALREAESRALSLVDHVSFVVMRELGISRAFAFDGDFTGAGFELVS